MSTKKDSSQLRKVYYWGGRHPINESIVNHPPEGFEIRSNMSTSQFSIVREYEKGYGLIKRAATLAYDLLGLPRLIWIRQPCDLLHTSSGVIPLNRRPWVVGVEYASSFVGLQEEKMQNQALLRKVARYLSSDYCKKVLPFSEACKKSIENAYRAYLDGFAHKIEVLYPAMEPWTQPPRPRGESPLRLLFVSGHFFDDGGREVTRAFEILEKKYDLELHMVVSAPEHHRTEFQAVLNKYSSHPRIRLATGKVPRKLLFENYYSQADIFVMPSYRHLFGYVLPEAMATGLPVVAVDVFALPEIVENNVNGFVVRSPLSAFDQDFLRTPRFLADYRRRVISGEVTEVTEGLVEKLSILIEDENLRKRMGEESRRMVETGKFSIVEQQRRLKRIYDEALEE